MTKVYLVLPVLLIVSGCASVDLKGDIADMCTADGAYSAMLSEGGHNFENDTIDIEALAGFASMNNVDLVNVAGEAALSQNGENEGDRTTVASDDVSKNSINSGLTFLKNVHVDMLMMSELDESEKAAKRFLYVPWLNEEYGRENLAINSDIYTLGVSKNQLLSVNEAQESLDALRNKMNAEYVVDYTLSFDEGESILAEYDDEIFDELSNINAGLNSRAFDLIVLHEASRINYYIQKYNKVGLSEVDKKSLSNEAEVAINRFSMAKYISVYFREYFRGGHSIELSYDYQTLKDKIRNKVSEKIDEADLDINDNIKEQLLSKLDSSINAQFDKVCKSNDDKGCYLTSPLGKDGFVTRYGDTVQFSGISVTVGSDGKVNPVGEYPQIDDVGPEIVRVLIEAMSDSKRFVPGSANSTACKKNMVPSKFCIKEGETDLNRIISTIDMYSAQAEATVTASASKIIRGFSWGSMNNEALARSIETTAGVTSRKITEKTMWKYVINNNCDPALLHISIEAIE